MPSQDNLESLVAELSAVLDQKTSLVTVEQDLKARIREQVAATGPDTYQAGDHTLLVQPNRRFDQARALELIPEQLRGLVTYPETVVDKDKLRALAPEIFEAAQVEGDYRVSVR